MSCSKHFLVFNWKQHDWTREVTHEERIEAPLTDMWGQTFSNPHVLCHTRYVCRDCGAIVGDRECTCDPERGEQCSIRLEYLAGVTRP